MNKQREALELALEAIVAIELTDDIDLAMKASRAIREALAEPEKRNQCGETCERAKLCAVCAGGVSENESVAYVDKNYGIMRINGGIDLPIDTKLYAAPPARKPLTDYQIRQIDEFVWKELTYEEKTLGQFALKMARAIERAHGIGGEE